MTYRNSCVGRECSCPNLWDALISEVISTYNMLLRKLNLINYVSAVSKHQTETEIKKFIKWKNTATKMCKYSISLDRKILLQPY